MTAEVIAHRLSLVVRPVDHFSGDPVADEFPLRLAGSLQRPVVAPGGRSRRQGDGAYRFVAVPFGNVRLLWREPFAREHRGWVRWDEDLLISVPVPDPDAFIDVELWPAANAATPASATGVRGQLRGPAAAGQTVRIAHQGDPFDRFTHSNDTGDFLFLPPGRLALDASGRIPMAIEVVAPDGTPRVVTGGAFVPNVAGPAFAGSVFSLQPRVVSRVVFELA